MRGAQNAGILAKNYQEIKTYGIGKDISWNHWQHYAIQLINQGYCEIAFHRNNVLQLTHFSRDVLFKGTKVLLSRPLDPKAQVVREKETRSRSRERGSLFERLRKLRHQISLEENIPAYLVFNDSALKEMEIKKPVNEEEFMRISGVGQRKLEVYGELFIKEIKDFQGQKKKKTENSQTFNATY